MQLDFPISAARLRSLRSGAVLVRDTPAVLQIEGGGALTCLQGLLTQDLAAPGDGTLSYGAMLTPKGMIVADLWALRDGERFLVVFESGARETVRALLGRMLPPRLAKVTDLSETWRAGWLLGCGVPERLARAIGSSAPAPGKVARPDEGPLLVASGPPNAPFSVLLAGPGAAVERAADALGAAAQPGTAEDLVASRVLHGWPTLGREIDERTLPQEVRFEENGGVSYTKGCYTGQETVARIHFRGHVNRTLRGLILEGPGAPDSRGVSLAGKEVGRVGTALLLDDRVLALGIVRREVEDGTTAEVGGRTARITPLPLPPEAWTPNTQTGPGS